MHWQGKNERNSFGLGTVIDKQEPGTTTRLARSAVAETKRPLCAP